MKLERQFEKQFHEIVRMIHDARYNAIKSVNTELIKLYWQVGEYISRKVSKSEWGEAIIDKLADYLARTQPDLTGFTRRGLYRMKRFFESYNGNQIVTTLLTQISWSHHLLILAKAKTQEEREYYIRLSIREHYSFRELERQIDSGFYERHMLSKKKVSPLVAQIHPDITSVFKDTYMLDFLSLPHTHTEKDLQKSIVENLKNFILEFGRDFTFVGEEYRIQVGNNDYFIDLLFFHRALRCLVMFELKITDFKPEYLGKLNFYLEALDRDVRKSFENPSVGIILCKNKDNEVVEFALSRSMSPALIAEYKTKLIPKRILQKKLHELFMLDNKH